MKKPILTFAIIAILPFGAMAENISGAMYVAPAQYDGNHPAPTTNAIAPYGRIDIDTADQQHVASTAYVKGAYNSAIAATNKVADTVSDLSDTVDSLSDFVNNDIEEEISEKQDALYNHLTDEYIGTNVVGANDELIQAIYLEHGDLEYPLTMQNMLPDIEAQVDINYSDSLITAEAAIKLAAISNGYKQQKLTTTVNNASQNISATVAQTVNTTTPSATTLVSEAAIAGAINGVTTNLSTNYATTAALNNKRVEIYTTWDNDNAKTEVAFVNASAQSGQ